LIARDSRLRERIPQFLIDGRDTQAQCFWLAGNDAGVSVMLLGEFAHSELPSPLTLEWLQTTCAS
jgi:hypothetical protein